jgi:hypothetical protein
MLAGCGKDDQHISSAAENRITPLVERVRRDVAARDRRDAAHALIELRRTVAKLEQQGEIGSGRADRILGAATLVRTRLSLVPATTTTTTTTTTVPDDEEHDRDKKHRGKDKGHDGDG